MHADFKQVLEASIASFGMIVSTTVAVPTLAYPSVIESGVEPRNEKQWDGTCPCLHSCMYAITYISTTWTNYLDKSQISINQSIYLSHPHRIFAPNHQSQSHRKEGTVHASHKSHAPGPGPDPGRTRPSIPKRAPTNHQFLAGFKAIPHNHHNHISEAGLREG